jgi:hypothetical protein
MGLDDFAATVKALSVDELREPVRAAVCYCDTASRRAVPALCTWTADTLDLNNLWKVAASDLKINQAGANKVAKEVLALLRHLEGTVLHLAQYGTVDIAYGGIVLLRAENSVATLASWTALLDIAQLEVRLPVSARTENSVATPASWMGLLDIAELEVRLAVSAHTEIGNTSGMGLLDIAGLQVATARRVHAEVRAARKAFDTGLIEVADLQPRLDPRVPWGCISIVLASPVLLSLPQNFVLVWLAVCMTLYCRDQECYEWWGAFSAVWRVPSPSTRAIVVPNAMWDWAANLFTTSWSVYVIIANKDKYTFACWLWTCVICAYQVILSKWKSDHVLQTPSRMSHQ